VSTHHNQDYFDRLLRRGPYNVRLSNLRDDELQQIVRDERKRIGETVSPLFAMAGVENEKGDPISQVA
jgi:hypothetical protein